MDPVSWDLLIADLEQTLKVRKIRAMYGILFSERNAGKSPRLDGSATRSARAATSGFEGGAEFSSHVGAALDLGAHLAETVTIGVLNALEIKRARPLLPTQADRNMLQALVNGPTLPDGDQDQLLQLIRILWHSNDEQMIASSVSTLLRAEKLLELIEILISESERCPGPAHSFTLEVRKAKKEGLDPWADNETVLSEATAIELLDRLRERTGFEPKNSVPRDFASFASEHPTFDGFWLTVLWKAGRLETALHEILRGMLDEAWSCPVEPESPEPMTRETKWDFMTERESFTERGARNPGKGHPSVEALGNLVFDRETERRSMTSEDPPKWRTMARTYPRLPDFDAGQALRESAVPAGKDLGFRGGLYRFARWFEKAKTDKEFKRVDVSLYEKGESTSKGYDEKDANVKYYGGIEELFAAVRKDFFPVLQPLRVADLSLWWKVVEDASSPSPTLLDTPSTSSRGGGLSRGREAAMEIAG